MSEKSDKLRAMLEKEKERRIKLNNRIEILERHIQEEDSAEVNEMVRTAKVTPEQLAALLRQSATATPNPAALSAVGATFENEYGNTPAQRAELDWLLYNKLLEYTQLVLGSEIEHYLSLGCDHGRLKD